MIKNLLAMKDAYLNDKDGATAIEYALIAAGVSIAIITVVYLLGDELDAVFQELLTSLQNRG